MLSATTNDEDEWTIEYERWLTELEEKVIQEEFGYEPGEFSVYPGAWWPLYEEGLTPRQAWQRALDAHKDKSHG